MNRTLQIMMDQADGGGAGSGSPSAAGDAGGAGAAAAQAGAGDGAGSAAAGTQGGQPAGAEADQIEIVWNGQKLKKTRAEVIGLAQQAYNVTQKEQALADERKQLAQSRKDYQDRLLRLEQIRIEIEKRGGGQGGDGGGAGEPPDQNEPLTKLGGKLATLEQKLALQDWEKAYGPAKQRFPDISEDYLVSKFGELIRSGEVEDNPEGLMKTAEAIAKSFDGTADSRLDKLLADPENPKVKAHNEKIIAAYVSRKKELADAGGDKGAGGAGTKAVEAKSIDEVAEKYLGR